MPQEMANFGFGQRETVPSGTMTMVECRATLETDTQAAVESDPPRTSAHSTTL